MQPDGYHSLSPEDVALIVQDRYRTALYSVLKPHLERFRKASSSMQELFERLDGFLSESMISSVTLDPAHRVMIDKSFRTLVKKELHKRFGDDIHLITDLEQMITSSSSLKEIQLKAQVEITHKKATQQ